MTSLCFQRWEWISKERDLMMFWRISKILSRNFMALWKKVSDILHITELHVAPKGSILKGTRCNIWSFKLIFVHKHILITFGYQLILINIRWYTSSKGQEYWIFFPASCSCKRSGRDGSWGLWNLQYFPMDWKLWFDTLCQSLVSWSRNYPLLWNL